MLIDIIKDLEKEVEKLHRDEVGNEIEYNLNGEIIIINGKDRKIYFRGKLTYRTKFETSIVRGIVEQRALNAGKISYAPEKSARRKRDLIVQLAKEESERNGYEFSYNEEKDEIKIKVSKYLRQESRGIGRKLGRPTKRIFEL
jgi:hypothetical protein|tara:strand:- start:1388 stop:1816 length:429 start_codon:yes stop_codon:yes gene_type:complete